MNLPSGNDKRYMYKKQILSRDIGFTEKLLSDINAMVVNISEIEGHIFDTKLLKKSLDAAVNHQPNLRINIDSNSSNKKFYEVSNPFIDPIVIESENSESWKTLAEKRMNMHFTYGIDKSLFRFVILQIRNVRKAYFFIELDHSISDGTSGMILLNDILTFYVKFLQENVNSHMLENNYLTEYQINSLEFLPNLEKLAFPNGLNNDNLTKVNDIKDRVESAAKKQIKPIVKTLELNPLDNKDEFVNEKYCKNYPLFYDGTKENFLSIKKFCKENNFTVGAMLMASLYFQLGKMTYENFFKNEEKISISINIDINLRHRLEQQLPKEHVALLICISKLEIEFNKNDSYLDLIKLVYQKLDNLLLTKDYLYEIEANKSIIEKGLQKTTEIDKNNLLNNPKQNIVEAPALAANLNFSNIGYYPFNPIHKLNCQELFKVKSLKCVGSPWTPIFSHYVTLVYSVEYMNYSIVYYGKDNKDYANELFNGFTYLSENCFKFSNLKFNDYLNNFDIKFT